MFSVVTAAGGRAKRCLKAAAEMAVGRDRAPAVRVHLEVEVGGDAVRVARVADVSDQLSRLDLLARLEARGVRNAVHAAAAVVVFGVRSLFRWMYMYFVPLLP